MEQAGGGKATGVAWETAGAGRLSFYESSTSFHASRSGKARSARWRASAWNREPGDLPTVPGEEPNPGEGVPAASTEVVMARHAPMPAAGRMAKHVWKTGEAHS